MRAFNTGPFNTNPFNSGPGGSRNCKLIEFGGLLFGSSNYASYTALGRPNPVYAVTPGTDALVENGTAAADITPTRIDTYATGGQFVSGCTSSKGRNYESNYADKLSSATETELAWKDDGFWWEVLVQLPSEDVETNHLILSKHHKYVTDDKFYGHTLGFETRDASDWYGMFNYRGWQGTTGGGDTQEVDSAEIENFVGKLCLVQGGGHWTPGTPEGKIWLSVNGAYTETTFTSAPPVAATGAQKNQMTLGALFNLGSYGNFFAPSGRIFSFAYYDGNPSSEAVRDAYLTLLQSRGFFPNTLTRLADESGSRILASDGSFIEVLG